VFESLDLVIPEAHDLEPLSAGVADLVPVVVSATEVSLLLGPHDAMTVHARYPLAHA